jgi:hypothetical protein
MAEPILHFMRSSPTLTRRHFLFTASVAAPGGTVDAPLSSMKSRMPLPWMPLLAACLLAAILPACSAVKRGKVVKKGVDRAGTKLHPGPIHWVDVRGENRRGETVTARVELFAIDWRAVKKNDWIAPDSYGLPRFFQRIHAYNEEQRAESGRFGATEKIAARPKPRSPRKAVAKRAPAEPSSNLAQVNPPLTSPTSADRTERYREVREQALEDPSVRELKDSIKTARSDDEQQRAWQEYRARLRDKMHAIDPSLGDLIDQEDAAPR